MILGTGETMRVLAVRAGRVFTLSCKGDIATPAWTAVSGPVPSDARLTGEWDTLVVLDGALIGKSAVAEVELVAGCAAITGHSPFQS